MTYNNYQINSDIFYLTEDQKELLDRYIYMVDHRCSFRELAKELMISKSKLHSDFHRELPYISDELYQLIKRSFR